MTRKLAILCTLAVGCADDPDEASLAVTAFTTTFEQQDYASSTARIAELDAAAELYPERADVTRRQGLARLWWLSEFGRDPSQDPSTIPATAIAMQAAFVRSLELEPEDHRVLGWLGATQVSIGGFTANPDLIAQGIATIDRGVEAHPEFNLFVRALVLQGYPRGSAELDGAIEAMWTTVDLCAGEAVDRENLDFSAYLDRETVEGPERVCWNTPEALHNFEGFFFYFGDMLVKAGRDAQAEHVYETAMHSSTYDTYPYAGDLEARVAMIGARSALYADADPANDPELIGMGARQCATCHAR
jgi:hypothetical protein